METLRGRRSGWALSLTLVVCAAAWSPAQDGEAARKVEEAHLAVQREHAAHLIDLARQCSAANDRWLTRFTLDAARLLDEAMVNDAKVPDPATPKKYDDLGMVAQVIEAIEDGAELSPPVLASFSKVEPLLADIAKARLDAAVKLLPIASEYRSLGRDDTAFAVARACRLLHRLTAREVYGELGTRLAEKRYESTTRSYLERLHRAHDKIGRAKGWQFRGTSIEVPAEDAENAALIATDKVAGDFTIETEVQFGNVLGRLMLVVAWIDSKNHCGLEYERGHKAILRLVHVDGGKRKELALAQLTPKTYDEFFPLRVRVAGGVMSTDLSRFPCRAELPIPIGAGVRCGLLRPGDGDRRGKPRKPEPIVVRNFFVQ